MPGVYLEYIKAGKFVVPVELTFQTETIKAPGDIPGLINTSKWIERQNWKEIKGMLKPAVEACIKFNETPLENIPKSHHISYGREVSLGYLIVANHISTPFLSSVLDTKKNCWTDDEDDEDELLGITDSVRVDDQGAEFTEFIPTNTAIRVCVVKKSVVSIDDARRIRKELGVRSDDARHYFPNEAGPSSLMAHNQLFPENIELANRENAPANEQVPPDKDNHSSSSDSEVENIPRTFGDPDEIRDAARIYPHLVNRDVDSGEDPDDDLSLPDIEPNPPKKKKGAKSRRKSASLSPSKSKRMLHNNNNLADSQEGEANFSDEDISYNKRGSKRSKRKRTVAVVEPMRTLAKGQVVPLEHAVGGAVGLERRRKARPGSSHASGGDKVHGRTRQPPAIDIIAPDDDRLTITNPPEPIVPTSPEKEAERELGSEKKKLKKRRKRRRGNIDDDPYKWDRLTPSPLFDNDEEEAAGGHSSQSDTEPDMPVLIKMVDSDEETKSQEEEQSQTQQSEPEYDEETPTLPKEQTEQASPDITQVKANATARKRQKDSCKRKIRLLNNTDDEENKKGSSDASGSIASSKKTKSRLDSSGSRSNSRPVPRENSRLAVRSDSKLGEPYVEAAENSENTRQLDSETSPNSQKSTSSVSINDNVAQNLGTMKSSPTGKPTSKKKLSRSMSKKASKLEKAQERSKPEMGDAQTQTEDLQVVEVRQTFPPCTMNTRSSSVEDLERHLSQTRSITSDSHSSQLSHDVPQRPQSPKNVDPDDELFSFESPMLPVQSLRQTILVSYEDSDEEKSASPENVCGEDSNPPPEMEEIPPLKEENTSPGSPQPGCSHWFPNSFLRPVSPPPPVLEAFLMPSPTSRPPRTLNRLFSEEERGDEPPKLGLGDSAITDESEDEPMPAGTEAANVSENFDDVGRTFSVITQPEMFKTGLKLIQKVSNQELTVEEVEQKFLLGRDEIIGGNLRASSSNALVPVGAPQRKRDLSPDICELVHDKRLKKTVVSSSQRRSRRGSFEELSRNLNGEMSSSRALAIGRGSVSEDEPSSDAEISRNNVDVMNYLRLGGSGSHQGTPATYEPHGDEFDMSQRSYCMQKVVPEYPQKRRINKIHIKAVTETPVRQIKEHFHAVRADLYGILRGTIASARHRIFRASCNVKKDLWEMALTSPFTGEQSDVLVNMIFDHLFPDKRSRCEAMDYINYVLLPEAVIRIFSRINNISYQMAETEIRFSACYDGNVPEGYYSTR